MFSRSLACALALIAPLTLATACKGGGDDTIDVEFITILQTSPVEGADDVQVGTRVGFQVSDGAEIDPATFNGQTFFLTDPDGNVITGSYTVGTDDDEGPDVGVMRLDEPLDVITRYTATITTGLVASGASLEEDFEWSFTTLDSEWGVSDWLESVGTGTSERAKVVVNPDLEAFAVWEYEETDGTSVWANVYNRTELWGTPTALENFGVGSSRPAIAADGLGNAFAVWQRIAEGTPRANIWSSRYEPGSGWGAPELIQSADPSDARSAAIAADANGNAIAVWIEQDMDTQKDVATAARYEPGSGWAEPVRIDDDPAVLVGARTNLPTAVGMDADGNAIALWSRPTVDGDVLWTNRYTAGAGWGSPELVKSDPATDVRAERLAVGANGDAFAIWLQAEGDREDVWASRYSAGAWSAPERVDQHDADDKSGPDIAVDGTGLAHAVWSQIDPDFANIWSRRYTPGTGWGEVELLELPRLDDMGNPDPDEDGDAVSPRIGTNTAGNFFVVWQQVWQDWRSIWSNRRDPGEEWVGAQLIEDEPRTAKSPVIAVDENRHAHAVWLHSLDTGIDWVRTNRFE